MTQATANTARKTLTARLGTSPKTLHRKAMDKAAAAPAPEGEALEELFPAPPAGADVAPAPAPDRVAPLAIETAVPDQTTQQAADDSAVAADGAAASADQTAAAPAVDIIESSAPAALINAPAAAPPSIVVEDQAALATPAQSVPAPAWSEADEKAFQAMAARRKAAGFQRRGRDVSAQRVRVGAVSPNPGTVAADIVRLVAERGAIGRGELLDLMATGAFAHPKGKGGDRGWSLGYVSGAIASGFLSLADEGDAVGERSPDASRQAA